MFRGTLVLVLGYGLLACSASRTDRAGVQVSHLEALAEAIARRVEVGDIPDHGLPVPEGTLFLVRTGDINTEWGVLETEHFSNFSNRIIVVSLDSLVAVSRARGGTRVTYLSVRTPTPVSENRWNVWLGLDYVQYPPPGLGKLCCCRGQATLEVKAGRLEFVEWGATVCA